MQNKSYKRKKVAKIDAKQLFEGILQGDMAALSRGITLSESKREADRKIANQLINDCLPHSGKSIRIGITGVPGVGKSTFIESFGNYLIEQQGKKVAVLAVDPSSKKTGGSILGDKTRMHSLSTHPRAYIRPSPSSGSLGGVAHRSREVIILCEAAGFDCILVETVGVGQSEIEVKEMTDFFLLLMLAGAGDELQGIKRGIMEMADGILINKADGENVANAKKAKREYQNALHLLSEGENGWKVNVAICSALEKSNLDAAWKMVKEYATLTKKNQYFEKQRKKQLVSWFKRSIEQSLMRRFLAAQSMQDTIEKLTKSVEMQELSPMAAVEQLFGEQQIL